MKPRKSVVRLISICMIIFSISFAQPVPVYSAGGTGFDVRLHSGHVVFEEPVNISNAVGVVDTLPSLAVDAQNNVHVVYMGTYPQVGAPDNVTTDVFYTRSVNGVFSNPIKISVPAGYYSKDPTVAVDSKGVVHVVFMRSTDQIFSKPEDDIYYVNNHTGSFDTVVQLVDGIFGFDDNKPFSSPSHPIILVDASDTLHISFMASNKDLTTSFAQVYYTNNIGGAFNTPELISNGEEAVGNHVMDLDGNGLPHFAYQATRNGGINDIKVYYAKALHLQPETPEFTAPELASIFPRGTNDFFPGLAIASNGVAHITFRDPYAPAGSYELLYTNNSSGSFSLPVNVSSTGFTSSLEFDAEDNLHVLYKRLGGQLAYTHMSDGSFSPYQDLPGYVSHASVNYFKIGSDQRFHVVYYFWYYLNEKAEYDIYYVEGTWREEIPIFLPLCVNGQ